MVRAQYHPASKGEANVEEEGTDEKSEHVRSSTLHCEYENIVGLEEAQVSQYPKPDQTVASSQHQAKIVKDYCQLKQVFNSYGCKGMVK